MLWALSRALNLLMHANIDYIVLLQSNLLLILLKKKQKLNYSGLTVCVRDYKFDLIFSRKGTLFCLLGLLAFPAAEPSTNAALTPKFRSNSALRTENGT